MTIHEERAGLTTPIHEEHEGLIVAARSSAATTAIDCISKTTAGGGCDPFRGAHHRLFVSFVLFVDRFP